MHRTARSAFSLAEVMIAMGILGVGMLMVAATFPVGLDQARIVAETSIAPQVETEARTALKLLLNAPATAGPRIGIPPDYSTARCTFRRAFENLYDVYKITPPPVSTFFSKTMYLDITGNNARDINNWLGSPVNGLGDPSDELGARVRYYPSITGNSPQDPNVLQPEIPYTWSVIYTIDPIGNNQFDVIFIIFINRRSNAEPQPVRFFERNNDIIEFKNNANVDSFDTSAHTEFGRTTIDEADAYRVSDFSEGGYLVSDNAGEIFTINAIDPYGDSKIDRNANLTLDHIPNTPMDDDAIDFWFIPADPNTGKSPCIGVSRYTQRIAY